LRYNTIYLDRTDEFMGLVHIHDNRKTAWSAAMGFEGYNNNIYALTTKSGVCVFAQVGGRAITYNNSITQNVSSVWSNVNETQYDSDNPPAHAPDGQPQHISDSYYFNNYRNGSLLIKDFPYIKGQLYYENEGCYVPTEDIHFWKHNPSFDVSSGVGVGLLSQRPLSCTRDGVAWWATDENKLYRWKNGRWELYYVPYTYPHSLRYELND